MQFKSGECGCISLLFALVHWQNKGLNAYLSCLINYRIQHIITLIDTGIEKGLIGFDEERNSITYIHPNNKRSYSNPEEKVQAETFIGNLYFS